VPRYRPEALGPPRRLLLPPAQAGCSRPRPRRAAAVPRPRRAAAVPRPRRP